MPVKLRKTFDSERVVELTLGSMHVDGGECWNVTGKPGLSSSTGHRNSTELCSAIVTWVGRRRALVESGWFVGEATVVQAAARSTAV